MFHLRTFISVCMVAAECFEHVVWAFSLPQGAWVLQCKTVNPLDFWWLLIMYSRPASCPKNNPSLPSLIIPPLSLFIAALPAECWKGFSFSQHLDHAANQIWPPHSFTTFFRLHPQIHPPFLSNLSIAQSLWSLTSSSAVITNHQGSVQACSGNVSPLITVMPAEGPANAN